MAAPKIYAQALFDICEEKSQSTAVLAELKELSASLLSNREIDLLLGKNLIDSRSRRKLVEALLAGPSLSAISQRFLVLLAERGRMSELADVVEYFENLINLKSGVLIGKLRTAVPAGEDDLRNISQSIGRRIGAKVELRHAVDPDLLGGFVAQVSGKTFDSSLRSQLEKMRTQLSQ